MYKIYYIITLCIFIISCGKEDTLAPTGARDDYFTISPDATDPESVLRRNFYETNGVHLLFNDTLRHEQRGTNADGTPYWFTEIIDLGYSMTSLTSGLKFNYLQGQTIKETGIDFAENQILSHLGSQIRPYSILLAGQIYTYNRDQNTYKYYDFYNGMRCLAISCDKIPTMSEDEIYTFRQSILLDIASNKIKNLESSVFTEFYSFCSEYYGEYYSDLGISRPTGDDLYAYGFISSYYSSFPSRSNDVTAFTQALFNTKEQEFKEKYANFPVIIQKYNIIKNIVMDMGFKF